MQPGVVEHLAQQPRVDLTSGMTERAICRLKLVRHNVGLSLERAGGD